MGNLGFNMDYLKKHWVVIILVLVMATSFSLMFYSAKRDSLTIDEKVHIPSGYLHTWKGNYLFNPEHPPLLNDLAGFSARIANPILPETYKSYSFGYQEWEFGDDFFYGTPNNIEKILIYARLPFILLTLGIIYLVFLFGRTLYNEKIALAAATLVAFEPNILAHGHLATTDIGLAFFWLLTLWYLRKYLLKPSGVAAVYLGLTLGLTLVSKFSGAIILPIIILVLFSVGFVNKKPFRQILRDFGIVLGVAILVIWFVNAFSMRGEMVSLFSPFEKFIYGLKQVNSHNIGGHWTYLNGMVSAKGWWYYFPLTLWYKLPVAILLTLFMAIISLFWFARVKYLDKYYLEILLIGLPIVIFFGISMLSSIDIGIRHILPILPLIYLIVVGVFNRKNKLLRYLLLIIILLQAITAFKSAPNYLAYFNEIAGGKQNGAKHLIDSNLDWDQNMKSLAKYVHSENISPLNALCWDEGAFAYYNINYKLLTHQVFDEAVAICVQQYYVPPGGFDFEWIKQYPPDANIEGGIYVWRFDLHPIK